MLPPLIRRSRIGAEPRPKERGFTMALVTVALVAIIAMAALSIDIGTLYQAKAEAQRAADAAALTGARVISISGITGDPTNGTGSWAPVCGGAASLATLAAINAAQQNLIGGVAVPSASVAVNYVAGKSGALPNADCTDLGPNFAVNPIVTVNVQRTKLPIFFARVFSLFNSNYSGASVSATASAEGFNPSNLNAVGLSMIPVQPRCVKPWIIPNVNAGSGVAFVSTKDGSIVTTGVLQLGGGVIGETFPIGADCVSTAADCEPPQAPAGHLTRNPPQWGPRNTPPPPLGNVLQYIPALVTGAAGAVPSCAVGGYQQAIAGCDQTTVYACGTPGGGTADLTINPGGGTGGSGDTSTAAQCLINELGGKDRIDTGTPTTPVFPFQMHAGGGNPLVKAGLVISDDIVTTSSSVVTLPIADYGGAALAAGQSSVTIVGFLQVFINGIDPNGNISVTVLNVAGCSNTATNPPVFGTSPVPVRLITPP